MNKEFRRIVLWSHLEGQQRTTDLDKRFTASLIEAMRVGQEDGLVRDDVKVLFYLSSLGVRLTIGSGEKLYEEN